MRELFWDDEKDLRPGEHQRVDYRHLSQLHQLDLEHRFARPRVCHDSGEESQREMRCSNHSEDSPSHKSWSATDGEPTEHAEDSDSDDASVASLEGGADFTAGETPLNTMPMAGWYEYGLYQTAIDVMVQLNIFSGRFDMRQLLASAPSPGSTGGVAAPGTRGDPYFHDHSAQRDELWLDFMADCGDGFDSSYTVARLLAQPALQLPALSPRAASVRLPRGEILLIGGDLAYPRPTRENFEERLLRVFEDAMPPPRGYPSYDEEHPVITYKTPSSVPPGAAAPPVAYIVPGNHDWFDGLSCFLRCSACSACSTGSACSACSAYSACSACSGL